VTLETGNPAVDLGAAVNEQLMEAGVCPGNIHSVGVCTRCSNDYFSYRRDMRCGRQAAIACILAGERDDGDG
jgi:hypothetical protein